MDSSRPSRFTVLNNDRDNIYISTSLLNKLSQPQQQGQQPAPESIPEPGSVPPSAAKKPAQPEFNTDSFHGQSGAAFATFGQSSSAYPNNAQSMPASVDPEFIAKHAQFDSGANLYALRGEYEHKLQQYQQVWRSRFDHLEGLNEQLFKLNSDKFAKEVKRVDERYFKSHSTYEVPCKAPEDTVIQCFGANKTKPLLCGDAVKQFSNCVEKTRIDILKR